MESTKAEANKGKKSHLKLILNIALFVILTGLALFYVLKDDPAKSFSLISTINLLPFLIALVIVALINLLDGITITSFAKIYNPHYRYSQGVVTALIGSFMGVFNKASSNLVQAYTLSKQDIKASHSASILTMNFLMYQLTLTVYSLIMVLVGYNSVKDIPLDLLGDMPIFYISLIGFSVDVIFLLIILFVGFSKTFHRFIINIGVSAIKILHIKKDPELLRKEWVVKITTYRVEFRRLFNHLGTDTIAFFIGLIKQFLLNSLPFFAIWCLTDVSSINFISCISGASYLNLITTFIPTGAPEVCFQAIYGYILQNQALISDYGSYTTACNLLWRFMTFYLPLIVGGLVFLLYRGNNNKRISTLSTSTTMYDLEIINLSENTNETETVKTLSTSTSENAHLLTNEELAESFERIRRDMIEPKQNLPQETITDTSKTLQLQKQRLSSVMKEAEALSKANNTPDLEIQSETIKELRQEKKHQKAVAYKQAEKNKKKQEKKEIADRKKLVKLQPKGTIMSIDKNKGIDFEGAEIIEVKTLTTSEEKKEN